MFHMPMSSPMMTTMFGRCGDGACACAGSNIATDISAVAPISAARERLYQPEIGVPSDMWLGIPASLVDAYHGCCFRGRIDGSESAAAIDRTATIHGCSRPYCFARNRARNRSRSQHHAGSYDATGGITDVLAVHHRTGL